MKKKNKKTKSCHCGRKMRENGLLPNCRKAFLITASYQLFSVAVGTTTLADSVNDTGGERPSIHSDSGDGAPMLLAWEGHCAYNTGCGSCTGCTGCKGCTSCTGCTGCTGSQARTGDCTGCTGSTGATMTREQKTDAMAAVLVNDMAIKSEKKGDLDRAIELYQKALALDSNNSVIRRNFAVAVNNRGIQIENSGDIDRALKYYQSALESKPNDLATAQAIAGNIQRVQDSIQRRANAWNLNNEGVKIEKTDLDGAIRLYQQASSLYPNDAIISGNLQRSKERKQRLLQDKSTADAVAEGQKIVAESIEKMTRGQGTSPDAPGPGMEFTGTPGNSEPVGLTFADVAAQMPDDMGDAPNSGVGKLSQFPNGNVQPDAKKLDETSSESGGTPAQGEELVSEGQRFGESLVDAAAGNAVVIMDGKNGAIKDPRGIRKLNLQGGPAKGGNLIRSTVAEGNCVVVTEKLMSSPEFGELVRDRDKKVETLRTFDKAVKALEQGEGVSSAPAALEELKQKLREAKDALTKTDQKILYVVKKANKREEVKTPPADDKTPETDDETLSPFDKQAADAIIKKVYDEPTTGEVGRRDGSREGKEK